ncbi:hypothetical protein ZHAS_00007636 [Anopheles sinensis]|uniref:Uncharacterized protein n=1 Tax=Anopheles sinensis TaxID=74873 RepID=A0A084VQ60_ANOSI|nr:hypothetical protein ZHAS_00007636 [Anopheles sinensis]
MAGQQQRPSAIWVFHSQKDSSFWVTLWSRSRIGGRFGATPPEGWRPEGALRRVSTGPKIATRKYRGASEPT